MLVAQSCPTLCDTMDCSPPVSSARGIFQARILEWLTSPSPVGLPYPGIETSSPALQADFLSTELWGKQKEDKAFSKYSLSTIYSMMVPYPVWYWMGAGGAKRFKCDIVGDIRYEKKQKPNKRWYVYSTGNSPGDQSKD